MMTRALDKIFKNELTRLLVLAITIFVLMTALRPSSFFSRSVKL